MEKSFIGTLKLAAICAILAYREKMNAKNMF